MSKNVSRIAPPKSSDAIQSGYPVIRAPNAIGKYVEISTDLKKCDYWMYALGAALAEKRKVNTNGTVRLQKLPARYKMYEHQRHQLSDLYIYGHPSKQRFRSATQFRRHLLWLESNSAKAKCDCSLCALLPTEKQEGKVEAKPHRVLSPAVRAAVTSRRSRTPISSPKAVHISQERSCLPDVSPEVLTPHKLGLSNPRPLKSRNKNKNG